MASYQALSLKYSIWRGPKIGSKIGVIFGPLLRPSKGLFPHIQVVVVFESLNLMISGTSRISLLGVWVPKLPEVRILAILVISVISMSRFVAIRINTPNGTLLEW